MHLESIQGKATAIVAAIVVVGSALIVEFKAVEDLAWFRIIKNCGLAFTIIGWFITWRRVTPYVRRIGKTSWRRPNAESPCDPIRIAAGVHRKGKIPRVEFLRLDRTHFTPVEHVIENNGDVLLKIPRHASIGTPDDFLVRVAV